jgi:hypothetical protein
MQPNNRGQARGSTVAFAYVEIQIGDPKEINNGIGRHSCRKCWRPWRDNAISKKALQSRVTPTLIVANMSE